MVQAIAYSQFVTLNLDAELLKTSDGSAMPSSGLVILVTSTLDSSFGGPTAGSFVSGDDSIIKKWDLTAGGGGGGFGNGIFAGSTGPGATPLSSIANWTAGDPLQMYWFPTLTLASSSPGAGTSYGQYRDGATVSPGADGSDLWVTDPTQLQTNLRFYTSDATFLKPGPGSNSAATGNASSTTVPEPSEYAMVFGMFCFAGALVKRGLRARSARS
jgi:hypothetical protein